MDEYLTQFHTKFWKNPGILIHGWTKLFSSILVSTILVYSMEQNSKH